jgi:hypothetical protein
MNVKKTIDGCGSCPDSAGGYQFALIEYSGSHHQTPSIRDQLKKDKNKKERQNRKESEKESKKEPRDIFGGKRLSRCLSDILKNQSG